MKNHSTLSLLILFLVGTAMSCKNDKAQVQSEIAVPKLISRSEKIQLGKEWDLVQNTYMDKKQTIEKNPKDHKASLELAQLYIKEARVTGEHGHYYPAALQMVDTVLKDKEINPDLKFIALLTKAGVQLSLHEFIDAKTTGEAALQLNNHNAQIYGVLVDANVELGHYDKAIALGDKMASLRPDIRSYSRIAYLREIHGDIDGAKAALKLAVESGYPGNEETAWAMLTLGELYSNYGDDASAKKVYSQIIEMRKDYPFAVAALAELELNEGNMDQAEKGFEEAIAIIPEVGFYTSLAKIYKKQGRQQELDEIVKEVFLMLEDDVVSGHNMNLEYADIYLNLLDSPKEALTYLEKEYDKRPLNIDVNRMLAQVYLSMDSIEETRNYAQAASITNSQHPDLLNINSHLDQLSLLF